MLRDVSLAIPRGQTVAVIGESGCGKTVLLKTIIGLLRPNRGAVRFDGRNLAELSDRELTRQRTAFRLPLSAGGPVRQHDDRPERLVSAAAAHPQDDRRYPPIVLARLAEVGLPESILSKKPAELSGGMRKRVGLARALAMEPEIMLYDEPTTGLDPIMSDVINELILSAGRHHPVTSIVVTHDMRTRRRWPTAW